MSPATPLESAAAGLQQAVERRDLAAVEAGARRYGELSRAAMAELPLAEAEARMRAARMVLESARRSICVARARISAHRARLERASGYRPPAAAVHTWSLEA